MNEKNTEILLNNFGKFFNVNNIHQSLMCFGFEVGDGWFKILYKLFSDIQLYLKDHPELKNFEVAQVKEKFGTLRIYIDGADDTIHKMVENACIVSETTCEQCGKTGKSRGGGWIMTLCDTCHSELTKRRKSIG